VPSTRAFPPLGLGDLTRPRSRPLPARQLKLELRSSRTATIHSGVWNLFYDNHVGVWSAPSPTVNLSMSFEIPNTPYDPFRTKDVWIQVTWQPDFGAQPFVTVDGSPAQLVLSAPVGNGAWFQNVYEFSFPFNPNFEVVSVSGLIDVGQVVIDTQCVPEPSSLALVALGAGLMLVLRRRLQR